MLKLIEQLINEHGSSVILKERLSLISDKYDILEEKNTLLESKNSELQTQLDKALSEITRLETLINQNEATRELVSDVEKQLLQFMFESNNEHEVGQIASLLNTDVSTAQYYLNELKDKKLINNFLSTMAPTTYKISKGGIKYIVETKSS